MVRLNITSAKVTYRDQDYAAAVATTTLTAHLENNAQVNSSQSSAAVFDMRAFIVNTGNSSKPQFIFSATAKATAMPSSEVTSASLQVGSKTTLQGRPWWTSFEQRTATKIVVSSATLTANSLSLQVKNSGNATADVRTVIVSQVSS